MNIVYLDLRPFSHFVRNGFRQRAGRILYHLIRSNRVNRLAYIWWNEDPFAGIGDELPAEAEYGNLILHEARRIPVPFARRLGLAGGRIDRPRIRKSAAACQEFKGENCWIWATDPRLSVPGRELANRLNGKLCIDLIDNFAVRYSNGRRKLFEKAYEDVGRLADKIVANNPEMQNYLSIPDATFRCVLSGVDWQLFHDGINMPEPTDIASIQRPRVGYVGTLSALNDVGLMNSVAEEVPECEVVFVGATTGENSSLHPRIHALGMKPYNELPAYVSHFDIGLSIYDGKHPSTQYGDSQKIKEFLAAGKPVVASDTQNIRTESTYICLAKDVDEFVKMVREAIRESVNTDLREKISLSVANQDWQERIAEIFDFLEESNA